MISWNEYHIGNAQSIKLRSKDPSTQVGCVIVSASNDPISQGYNGNIAKCDESFVPIVRPQKYLTIMHAEQSAIVRTGKTPDELKALGAKAYITDGPCETCLKLLLACNIREIWYADPQIMRDRSSTEQKAAIKALILATSAQVNNINGTSYLEELGVL